MSERPTYITEDEFVSEIKVLLSKKHYPLEYVSLIKAEDKEGIFFMPAIQRYGNGDTVMTGNKETGYKSRQTALACVGRLLDKAHGDI